MKIDKFNIGKINVKGKPIPLLAWTNPSGSTISRNMKILRLSALRTGGL
jgi:hypothetical protein